MDWSCEYEFNELAIVCDDIPIGQFWGLAELALDDDGMQFYVKNIIVYSVSLDDRHLNVSKSHWLWNPLCEALYKDEKAADLFWSEYTND